MISVIVPVYNSERTLPRCIDSALNSTYGDFELILVNDGYTDNSPVLCRAYCGQEPGDLLLFDYCMTGQGVTGTAGRKKGSKNIRSSGQREESGGSG